MNGSARERVVRVAGGLVAWMIESFGVAVDQWKGSRADPATVTAGAAWLFVATTIIRFVPAWRVLRQLPGSRH